MKSAACETATEIEKIGRKSHVVLGDVSKRADVEKMCESHVEHVGPLYTMVANAGICQVKSALEVTEKDMEKMFQVNVFGVFNCYQAAAKQMIKQGTQGRIIGCARYAPSHGRRHALAQC
jgi:NAD(P)-dependent dehydrogenase (short-subunit alcohol dehydrogenase family)